MPAKTTPKEASKHDKQSSESDDEPANQGVMRKTLWKVGDRVLCNYDGLFYEAKIISIKHYSDMPSYTIHYPRWDAKYDEEIAEEDAKDRFKPFSEAAKKEASEAMKEAKISAKKTKRYSRNSYTPVTETDKSVKKESNRISSEKKASKRALENSVTDTPVAKAPKRVRKNSRMQIGRIELTENLKKILEMDYAKVKENLMLPELPSQFSVQEIAQSYIETIENDLNEDNENSEELLDESAKAEADILVERKKGSIMKLLQHFNSSVIQSILFPVEVPMISDLLEGKSGFGGLSSPSSIEDIGTGVAKDLTTELGIVYLLRMLEHLHEIFAIEENLTHVDVDAFFSDIQSFTDSLDEGALEIYEESYYPASLEYLQRVI